MLGLTAAAENSPVSDRRVVVHIGFPKTATTSIQNAFFANRSWLLSQEGMLYPSLSPNLTNALCTSFLDDPLKHISNQMEGLSRQQARERGAQYRQELEREFRSESWSQLLLSAEGLSNLSAVDLTGLREWLLTFCDSVWIIAWARHPLSFTRSVIQQLMKGGRTLDEMYANLPLPNYKGKLSNAIQVFGRERIQVFSFESASAHPNGVAAAFAEHVGLKPQTGSFLAASVRQDNESLSELGVQVLDSLNRLRPMFLNGERNPERSGRELIYLSRLRGLPFQLPPAVAERILIDAEADIRWLNANFDTGFDYELPTNPESPRLENQADRDIGRLNRAAIESIAEIIGDLVNRR